MLSSNGGSECYDTVKALLVSPGVHEGRGREKSFSVCEHRRAEQTEDIPTGDKMLTRKRVNIAIEFIDNDVGRRIAILFQS